jgi:hypothetical protein
VFGGELSPDEKERLALSVRPQTAMSNYPNWSGNKIGFFYIADMNGDGTPEVIIERGEDVYLIGEDGASWMRWVPAKNYTPETAKDNMEAISADEHMIIPNRWNMLRINDKIFFVDPAETVE